MNNGNPEADRESMEHQQLLTLTDNSGDRIPATGNKSFIFLAVHSGLYPYITLASLFCPVDKGQIEKDGGKTGRKKRGKQKSSVPWPVQYKK